jgi:hypothetical protein
MASVKNHSLYLIIASVLLGITLGFKVKMENNSQ